MRLFPEGRQEELRSNSAICFQIRKCIQGQNNYMKNNGTKFTAPALTLAALVSLTACSTSDEGKGSSEVTRSPGHAGEIRTYRTTATVTGIDFANRRVTLTRPDGERRTYTVGPEARNFDQIRIGDQVNTTLTEEVALSLNRTDAPAS